MDVQSKSPTRETVFIVDDDEDLRALVAAWLRHEGITVHEFASGEACLEALSRLTPATILLDLNMPGQGGVPTLKLIKSRNRFVPVIVSTAEREVETVVSVMQE